MSSEFDRFTDDDKRALAAEFGLPLSEAEGADAFVRAQYKREDQEKMYPEERDWIRIEDVGKLLQPEIFMERFIEDCFRDVKRRASSQEASHLLKTFYNWKHTKEDDYLMLNSRASLQAADIIRDISINDVYEYASFKAERFSSEAYTTKDPAATKRAKKWNSHARVLNRAAILDLKLPK